MSGAAQAAARGLRLVASGSLLALFVVPIVALALYPPLDTVLAEAADPAVRASVAFTLLASGIALAVTLLLGVPLGHLLARRKFPGRSVVEAAVALPVVVPHLIAGLAILLAFAPQSPLGALAVRLGVPVFATVWGVVLVMVYVSAPYTVLASELAFRAVDDRLLETARSLGASPTAATRTIALPLALRGIVAGALLSWARAVSEIGGLLIVAYTVYPSGPYAGPVTSPISVYIYTVYQISLAQAAAISVVFVLVAFALFVLVRLVERAGGLPWRAGALPL
ncbi:MAG TPA: ABC transporter permease [Thermoplasmata archaeon]|nr:ABC transporter permease [Thermoplasmata archaeon]